MLSVREHVNSVDVTSHCLDSGTTQTSTTAVNGLPSPISTLLEELLIIIFDDVITSESSSWQRIHADRWSFNPTRNLASVSRAWRDIVFACPRLWRHVHLAPARSVHALREQLHRSSLLPLHLTVHQRPFRSPNLTSGPSSIATLTAQLQYILTPSDEHGSSLAPASQRVESITINALQSASFLNFVLHTWMRLDAKFPILRQVTMNGNVCATWSRANFFNGNNAPGLERLELNNVVIAHNTYRLSWDIGLNLTTLVWRAPTNRHGSLVVSVSCFHHVLSSFPSLTSLELHEHAVGLEFANPQSLDENGITPLAHVRELRVSGRVFPNARAAYVLFSLLPSLRRVVVRGRACTGPLERRTVSLALQGLIYFPKSHGWPNVLPELKSLVLECVETAYEEWKMVCTKELELWRRWRETMVNAGGVIAKTEVHMAMVEESVDGMDEDE